MPCAAGERRERGERGEKKGDERGAAGAAERGERGAGVQLELDIYTGYLHISLEDG